MINPAHPRLQHMASAYAKRLPVTWRLWASSAWSVSSRLEWLSAALQIAGVLVAAIVWLVGVALLVQGLVSWWVELESYTMSAGVIPAWHFPSALD
jgi:hypothetical protein